MTAPPHDATTPILQFRVEGPVTPYTRMTQGSKWTARAQKYLAYRGEVTLRAKEAGAIPVTGPVALHIHVAAKGRRYDLDNVIKCVGDSLNGVAYVDDKQVVKIAAVVRDGDANYLHVTVEQLPTVLTGGTSGRAIDDTR